MRGVIAGLISLFICALSFGQLSGEVESVGFNSTYRPDCFTPMVVRIRPQGGMGGLYQIVVKQKDLDGDLPAYTRTISITGEEGSRDQRFSMYFLPQPSGLPDLQSGGTVRDLQKELKVFLYKNGKQIASLPITSQIANVDPPAGGWNSRRGMRMILAVTGNGSMPSWIEYQDASHLLGVLEDVLFVPVNARDLPENAAAYDAVDAILWMNVDPAELRSGGDERFRALQTYVRQGGHLVICQSPEWQKYLAFGDLLPVTLQGVEQKKDLYPLRDLARLRNTAAPDTGIAGPWDAPVGPFTITRAKEKPNTIVEEWVQWDTAADRTPYIVRQGYGLGAVSWVAQDLGDSAITSFAKAGWVYIWDRVFDWHNQPLVVTQATTDSEKAKWALANSVDMGKGLLHGLDLGGTVSALVAVAVAFFILYWVIAGPGMYAWLVSKRRQHLSWFGFAVSAIVATFATVLIVKLIVRGPPELAHSTIISQAASDPAIVRSRFGLYIKADGDQRIELTGGAPGSVSTLTPLPLPPAYLTGDSEVTAPIDYTVPVRDAASTEPPALTIYYRSTLKKFEATWVGQLSGTIEGIPKLAQPSQYLDGIITNGTGQRLENVYLAYKYPDAVGKFDDWVLWMDSWDPGNSIHLDRFFMNEKNEKTLHVNNTNRNTPLAGGMTRLVGRLKLEWQDGFWNGILQSQSSLSGDGYLQEMRDSFVLLSLFDRLGPLQNEGQRTPTRVELLRRGGRHLDRSAALAAGSMVILAQSKGPLPIPLEVEGNKTTGDGTIYYQFVLPMDRKALSTPATEPADAN